MFLGYLGPLPTGSYFRWYFTISNRCRFFGNKPINIYRISGLFGDEPILGRYVVYLMMLTFTIFYQNSAKTKKNIIISVFFLLISEISIFISGERVPLFYAIFLAY